MKTVIVFDTEDPEGMKNTLKIVDHLAKQYMSRRLHTTSHRSFGKIQFIKAIRRYQESRAKQAEADPEFKAGLRSAKQFTDEFWGQDGIQ